MSKKDKKANPLDALDARIRALEVHHGWMPGEVPPGEYIGDGCEPPVTSDEPDDDSTDDNPQE